ncbi:MAG: ABC transporter ATP-binding protein [Candidatus Heimdallarchaeaceae archaeon]
MNKVIKIVVICVENLYKIYKAEVETIAIQNLSFEVKTGEICGVVGPSGSGKTTLLHCLAGILQPTSGKIFFDQNNIIDYSIDELVIHRRDTVGLIYQDYNLLHDFKVKENIALPMIIAGKKKDEINKRIHYLSSKLGVERYINTFPHRLSGGEQQRVGIAVALANNPDVILADEPTGNLDRTNSDIVFDLLVDICKKEHKTLIIATHDINLQKKLPKLISLETGD